MDKYKNLRGITGEYIRVTEDILRVNGKSEEEIEEFLDRLYVRAKPFFGES